VAGSPHPPPKYRLAPVFAKLRFNHPTSLTELPDDDRLLVTEIGGKIFTFAKSGDVAEADLAIDLVELLPKEVVHNGVALWSATLHPEFTENRQVFVCYRSFVGGEHNRVARFALSDARPPRIDAASEKLIIKYPSGPHSAGCILFGVDGMLYISVGDGAGPNPPDNLTTGQDITDLLGSILRIDVDSPTADAAYGVPADNPFVSTQGARPEVWAYGLRNPWKFGIDRQTGAIFAADNGWETWEMVHRIVRDGRSRGAAQRSKSRPHADSPACERPSPHRSELGRRRAHLSWKETARSARLVRLRRLHHRHDLGNRAAGGRYLLA
jgi:glucose/arabinose dehydrogenase